MLSIELLEKEIVEHKRNIIGERDKIMALDFAIKKLEELEAKVEELEARLKDDVEIQVPITENDLECTFKPIVYKDEGGDTWSFESSNGQNVVINFINGEGTE